MLDSSHRHLRYLPVKLLTFTFYISKIYFKNIQDLEFITDSKPAAPSL